MRSTAAAGGNEPAGDPLERDPPADEWVLLVVGESGPKGRGDFAVLANDPRQVRLAAPPRGVELGDALVLRANDFRVWACCAAMTCSRCASFSRPICSA